MALKLKKKFQEIDCLGETRRRIRGGATQDVGRELGDGRTARQGGRGTSASLAAEARRFGWLALDRSGVADDGPSHADSLVHDLIVSSSSGDVCL